MTADDIFTFILQPAVYVPEGQTYPGMDGQPQRIEHNGADGKFSFTLTYTDEDYNSHKDQSGAAVFTYQLTEQVPDTLDENRVDLHTNIKYSDQTFWIQVTLTKNDGQLEVEKKYYTENPLQPVTVTARTHHSLILS